jgi:hypothetical protein
MEDDNFIFKGFCDFGLRELAEIEAAGPVMDEESAGYRKGALNMLDRVMIGFASEEYWLKAKQKYYEDKRTA